MRKVASFSGADHDKLTEQINTWLTEHHATPISISISSAVIGSANLAIYFYAFVIYEQQSD